MWRDIVWFTIGFVSLGALFVLAAIVGGIIGRVSLRYDALQSGDDAGSAL